MDKISINDEILDAKADALLEWQEEDKDNRAVVILAVDNSTDAVLVSEAGSTFNLTELFANALMGCEAINSHIKMALIAQALDKVK